MILAVQFLTIVTVWPRLRAKEGDLAGSMAFFPLVGLGLGLVLAGSRYWFRFWPPVLADAVAVGLMLVLTRGLHFEGLADAADGLVGGLSREKSLEIMRDSRAGSFAVMAVALVLLLDWAALMSLGPETKLRALVVAPILGRLSMVIATYKSAYARAEDQPGLGRPFAEGLGLGAVAFALLTGLIASILVFGARGAALTGGAIVFGLVVKLYLSRRLGGVTGDCLGAAGVLAEMGLFMALAGLGSWF